MVGFTVPRRNPLQTNGFISLSTVQRATAIPSGSTAATPWRHRRRRNSRRVPVRCVRTVPRRDAAPARARSPAARGLQAKLVAPQGRHLEPVTLLWPQISPQRHPSTPGAYATCTQTMRSDTQDLRIITVDTAICQMSCADMPARKRSLPGPQCRDLLKWKANAGYGLIIRWSRVRDPPAPPEQPTEPPHYVKTQVRAGFPPSRRAGRWPENPAENPAKGAGNLSVAKFQPGRSFPCRSPEPPAHHTHDGLLG